VRDSQSEVPAIRARGWILALSVASTLVVL